MQIYYICPRCFKPEVVFNPSYGEYICHTEKCFWKCSIQPVYGYIKKEESDERNLIVQEMRENL